MVPRRSRDKYWDALANRFPRIPVGWSITDGQLPGPEMRHGTSILSCVFSPDSSLIAAGGGGCIPGCDTSIRLWDAKTGQEKLICRGHTWGIFQLAFDARTGF